MIGTKIICGNAFLDRETKPDENYPCFGCDENVRVHDGKQIK